MQTVTDDDTLVTLRDAAKALGVAWRRLTALRDRGILKPVGTHTPFVGQGQGGLPPQLFRLGNIREALRVVAGRNLATLAAPVGHLKPCEAASRLGVSGATVRDWMLKGRLAFTPVQVTPRRVVRFPSEEGVRLMALSLAKVDQGQSTLAKVAEACEAADAAPVLYGLLSAADAAVLERRRARRVG